VARVLESKGFTFTGSSSQVLAMAWEKSRVKASLEAQGIPTPRWMLSNGPAAKDWNLFPAIVKPAMEHCSYGLTPEAVVLETQDMRRRITYVRDHFNQPAIVEDFIDGREFHVSIWGNGKVAMLPVAEMDFSAFDDIHDRLCTFDSKFTPGSVHYSQIQLRLPAALTRRQFHSLEQTALAAYRCLGCRDYARLDIRLRDGVFYVLDVNPNPDISPDASMACAAEVAGYSYGAMASRMINLAARRHPVFGAAANAVNALK
jgi:D-alanine-D-alanine ligase